MLDSLRWAGELLWKTRKRGEAPAVRRRRTREEKRRRIALRLQALYDELRKSVSTRGMQREVEVEAMLGAMLNEGLVQMLMSCEMQEEEDTNGSEGTGPQSDEKTLDMSIKKAKDWENYVKSIEELTRGVCGKEGKVTQYNFKVFLNSIMKRIDTKKDAVELPSFESLGVSMPQTVFLSNGQPTSWYYTSGGRAGKLMRRTSEKTNMLYIEEVFEAEHLKELDQDAPGKGSEVSRWEACCVARVLRDGRLHNKFLSLKQFKSFIQSNELQQCFSFARVCDRKFPRRRWNVVYTRTCPKGEIPVFLCWDSPAACLQDTEEGTEEMREQDQERYEMQQVEVRSEDKVVNWMMEQRARGLVQALECQAEVNILKARFTFCIDSSKGMRSNLFLIDCQDVVMETDVDRQEKEHKEISSRPLSSSRQACRGDYCDGSYPYDFAQEVDLIQKCQLGSYDSLYGVGKQKGSPLLFVSYQILALDRKRSNLQRVYAVSSKQVADLSTRNVNQHLHVGGRGRALNDGVHFWAEYQGEISTDVCLTLTSPSGTVGKIHRYSSEHGARSGVDVTQPTVAPVLADKLRIVQILTCFGGEEIHGEWSLSHPVLEAGQQFNPAGPAPQLLGWGFSISYRLPAESSSGSEGRSRPPSAKAAALMQPRSTEKRIRPFSANTWKKVEHKALEAVGDGRSQTDRPSVGSFSSLGRMELIDNVPVCLHCYAVYAKIWKDKAVKERTANPFKPMESRSARTQRTREREWVPWLTLSPVEEQEFDVGSRGHQQQAHVEQHKENVVWQQRAGATDEQGERADEERRKEKSSTRRLHLKRQEESTSGKGERRKETKPQIPSKSARHGQAPINEQRAQHEILLEQLLHGDLTSEQAFCRLTGRALTEEEHGKQEDGRRGDEQPGAAATLSLPHDREHSKGSNERLEGVSYEWVWNQPTGRAGARAGGAGTGGEIGQHSTRHSEVAQKAQGNEDVGTAELLAAYDAEGTRGRRQWTFKVNAYSHGGDDQAPLVPRVGRLREPSSSSSSWFPERIGTVGVVDGALIERKALPNSRPWK
eukprot:767320-Hanusia_phi.AAC.15